MDILIFWLFGLAVGAFGHHFLFSKKTVNEECKAPTKILKQIDDKTRILGYDNSDKVELQRSFYGKWATTATTFLRNNGGDDPEFELESRLKRFEKL